MATSASFTTLKGATSLSVLWLMSSVPVPKFPQWLLKASRAIQWWLSARVMSNQKEWLRLRPVGAHQRNSQNPALAALSWTSWRIGHKSYPCVRHKRETTASVPVVKAYLGILLQGPLPCQGAWTGGSTQEEVVEVASDLQVP